MLKPKYSIVFVFLSFFSFFPVLQANSNPASRDEKRWFDAPSRLIGTAEGLALRFMTLILTKINSEVLEIVSKLEKGNSLDGSKVGYGGVRTDQFNHFIKLKSVATNQELTLLTEHPNGVVRAYAFWALSERKNVELLPILQKHIQDDALIRTLFGCLAGKEKVGDWMIQHAVHHKKINTKQIKKLNKLLVFTPNHLRSTADALAWTTLSQEKYHRIRQLVLEGEHPEAIVSLAKFQNEQDISLILNFKAKEQTAELSSIYKAIRHFPHEDFFAFLSSQLQETLSKEDWDPAWKLLYQAIVSYQNKASLELLKMVINKKDVPMREYHLKFMTKALGEQNNGLYDQILWALWRQEHQINSRVFDYLYSRFPDQAYQQVVKDFEDPRLLAKSFSHPGFYPDVNRFLTIVLEKDRSQGERIIQKKLRESDVHLFRNYVTFASKLRSLQFVEPLFKRLSEDKNPHIYLAAAEALLGYQDPRINKKILEIRKQKDHLREGWGGKSLVSLLKEYQVLHKGSV